MATPRRAEAWVVGVAVIGWLWGVPAVTQETGGDWHELTLRDPAKVVTADACGECHALEYEVWEGTPHETGFRTLHRKASAEEIAQRMGFQLIKRESLCLKCHYTAKVERDQLRAVSGVSCESCHGAGRDWIDVHNNYGPGADRTTETPEHRRQRIEASQAAGMRRPSDIYDTAKSCFECHTVPEEMLVNKGGHSTGSATFELVEWSQGEIRHNFLGSLTGGSRENVPSSPERRRRLYLAGRLLDLEYSLRGLARATSEGTYSKAMSRRIRGAVAGVRGIALSVELPEIDELLETVRSADISVGRSRELTALADSVGSTNRGLLAEHDGTDLVGLDRLIAGEGPPADSSDDADVHSILIDPPDPGTTADPGATGGATASSSSGGAARGGVPAEGDLHRFLRPRSSHRTLGSGACSGCHGDQNAWWFDDRHFSSADRFFDRDPDAVRIATLYGISPGAMTHGDALCMDCHGTVVSGQERQEVLDGVGCESCHGPAADWLEPHKEGEASLGRERPGFVAALRLGKNDLQDLSVRAATCASCHYITDRRLLSAGHPSGESYQFAAAVTSIRHWSRPVEGTGQLQAAWTAELGRRGPVPSVRLASLPEGGPAVAAVAGGTSSRTPRRARTLSPRPRDVAPAGTADEAVDLGPIPPFPEIGSESSVEEVLLLLKQRLEMLYELVDDGEEEP